MNRSYTRARNGKLRGHQLDLAFPRRGRPSKHRVLERCGQMRLDLTSKGPSTRVFAKSPVEKDVNYSSHSESLDDALQMCFPVQPLSEDELAREFARLFPD